MASLNLCQFIGRAGQDPTTRYTSNGMAIANLSIAVSYKSKGEETTEWVRVSAFDKLAEIIAEYVKEGSLIYISGRMQTRKWQDKSGEDKYSTEIIADRMQMLGGKSEKSERQEPRQKETHQPTPNFDDDQDIPF